MAASVEVEDGVDMVSGTKDAVFAFVVSAASLSPARRALRRGIFAIAWVLVVQVKSNFGRLLTGPTFGCVMQELKVTGK